MKLEIESVARDVSDFWRPRLEVALRMPASLRAGLCCFRLRTARPSYATLRLHLQGSPAPMTVFLDREEECRYAKSFNTPRPIAGIVLEIEPHLEPDIVISADLEPVGFAQFLLARAMLRHLAAPAASARKLRQVVAGSSRLAFSAGRHVDQRAVYASWRAAFESEDERQRIAVELRRIAGPRTPKLLFVSAEPWAAPELVRDFGVAMECLPIDARAASLAAIFDAAERAGALAFVFHETSGTWSALGPMLAAVELLRHPDCVAVYGDCDRLDEHQHRIAPHFKPAWSPRHQLAADYVGSAVAFRLGPALRALTQRVGEASVTGRHLIDALARQGDARAVRHVPRIFLHERPVSTLMRPAPSTLRGTRPSVSVIIPTRDNPRLLRRAARSVLEETSVDLQLIVVDNGSQGAKQRRLLLELGVDPRVSVIRHVGAFNFSALVNRGAAASRGELLVLLNDDTEATAPGWLGALLDIAAEADAGCVGALLLYPSGRIQHAGIILGIFGIAGHALRGLAVDAPAARKRLAVVHEVAAVTGACLAVKRILFEAVGGFDEALPVTLNDVDFCLRLRARGHACLMAPHVRLVHHESASRGLDAAAAEAERLAHETAVFLEKWGAEALRDPYYSPHLTVAREDCTPRDI